MVIKEDWRSDKYRITVVLKLRKKISEQIDKRRPDVLLTFKTDIILFMSDITVHLISLIFF